MRFRAKDELAEQRDQRPIQPVPAYAEVPALPRDALPRQRPATQEAS